MFNHLRDNMLPALIRKRRSEGKLFIRLWSAACSSGEEPYSLALLLRYLLPDYKNWDIYLLGTDINQDMINRAICGEYSRWSFRNEPAVPIGQYFSLTTNNNMRIDEDIRKMVTFKRFNLIPDTYLLNPVIPAFLDMILCRNVLMYFRPEQSVRVIDYLTRSLITNGNLIVSPQEIGIVSNPELSLIRIGPIFIHIKQLSHDELFFIPDLLSFDENSNLNVKAFSSEIFQPANQPDNQPNKYQDIKSDFLDISDSVIVSEDIKAINSKDLSAGLNNSLPKSLLSLDYGQEDAGNNISMIEDLIKSYAGKGEYEKASGWCDRMIAKDPLYPKSYLLKSAILEEQDLYSDAIISLRQALFADPDYLQAHLLMAGIFKKIGKMQEAHHHYELALQILNSMDEMEVLEESEGIPVLKMKELIQSFLGMNIREQ